MHSAIKTDPLTLRQNQAYLQAKGQALELVGEAGLWREEEKPQFLRVVARISGGLGNSLLGQRGEVYLLLCRTALRLSISCLELPLPADFITAVISYLSSLLETQAGSLRQKDTSNIYTHRYRLTTENLSYESSRSQLSDLLLIERYDQLLLTLLQQLKNADRLGSLRLSKHFTNFLLSTFKKAQRYLSPTDYRDYRFNIESLVKFFQPKEGSQRLPLRMEHNIMLIDRGKAVAQSLHLRPRRPSPARKESSSVQRSS
jgi:hypothetical protein